MLRGKESFGGASLIIGLTEENLALAIARDRVPAGNFSGGGNLSAVWRGAKN